MRRFSFLRAQWCASKLGKIGLCLFFIHKQRLSLSLIFVYTFCALSPLSSSLKAPFNETAHFYTSIFSSLPNNPIKYNPASITLPIGIANHYAAMQKRESIASIGLPSHVQFTVKISSGKSLIFFYLKRITQLIRSLLLQNKRLTQTCKQKS